MQGNFFWQHSCARRTTRAAWHCAATTTCLHDIRRCNGMRNAAEADDVRATSRTLRGWVSVPPPTHPCLPHARRARGTHPGPLRGASTSRCMRCQIQRSGGLRSIICICRQPVATAARRIALYKGRNHRTQAGHFSTHPPTPAHVHGCILADPPTHPHPLTHPPRSGRPTECVALALGHNVRRSSQISSRRAYTPYSPCSSPSCTENNLFYQANARALLLHAPPPVPRTAKF